MTSCRRRLEIGLFVSASLCLAVPAQAHSPIEGIGTFYSYMLHTLVAPAHGLLLVGTALMLGQQERDSARIGLAALAAAFVAGVALSGGGLREWQLLAAALIAGAAVSGGRKLPVFVLAPAVTIAGLAIGLDSPLTGTAQGEELLAFAGLVTGFAGFALVVTGLTMGLTMEWQRIGVRIAGSWIVAVAILMLALSLTEGETVWKVPPQPNSGHTY